MGQDHREDDVGGTAEGVGSKYIGEGALQAGSVVRGTLGQAVLRLILARGVAKG